MNPEQWLSLKWNGGSTMSDRWLNQSKIIHFFDLTKKAIFSPSDICFSKDNIIQFIIIANRKIIILINKFTKIHVDIYSIIFCIPSNFHPTPIHIINHIISLNIQNLMISLFIFHIIDAFEYPQYFIKSIFFLEYI